MDNPTQELTATTPETQKTPEHYEQAMLQTRESLTAKVSALESQVVGTVQTAADTLTGTVGAVKSLMDTAPAAVGDSMKQAATVMSDKIKEVFDVSKQVQNRPWACMAASMGVGFITGLLVFRERSTANQGSSPVYAAPPTVTSSAPSAARGLFDDLTSMLGRKVKELAETAIDSASTAANQSVRDNVPKLVDAAAEAAGTRLNGVGQV